MSSVASPGIAQPAGSASATHAESTGDALGLTPEAPWLGLRSFTERVRDYFFGRDVEIQELVDRIQHKTLTVLFGQSGLGKTSLLQAGVIPRLREADFIPILIRLVHDQAAEPLEQQVVQAIADAIPAVQLPAAARPTLWELFHDRSFGLTGDDRPPVLIFDQFEELFTLGEEKRPEDARRFFESLSCLVENRPPPSVRWAMEEDDELINRLKRGPASCKILLALRDDYLSRLERGRQQMPSLMDNRVELRLLSGPQAYRAVYEPGTKNSSGPIVSRETARAIVRFVAGANPGAPLEEIENVPPLLSLICEQLNARRLAQGESAINSEALTRSAPEVLRNFYNDSFAVHPQAVRVFVEEELVSASGFRESKTLDTAMAMLSQAGVTDPEAALRQLVDQRLLVIEDRGAVARIELTHDILAPIAAAARKDRAARERRRAAERRRFQRFAILVLLVLAVTVTVTAVRQQFAEQRGATQAQTLIRLLRTADTSKVPATIQEMSNYRKWVLPLLQKEEPSAAYQQRLNTHLARFVLLPADRTEPDLRYLYDRLLDLDRDPNALPIEFIVIRDALSSRKSELRDGLWGVLESPETDRETQLRAASALAAYDPDNPRWSQVRTVVANDLAGASAVYLSLWVASLRPVRAQLIEPLCETYRSSLRDWDRSVATDILADYAADQPAVLTRLVLDADQNQFGAIYSAFEKYRDQQLPELLAVLGQNFGEIDRNVPPDLRDEAKEKLAKQQANAAVILLKMRNAETVWPLLKHGDDPRSRSYLIHRVNPLGADPQPLIDRLDQEPDVTIRRALLLCLGEFDEDVIPAGTRQRLLPKVQELYRTASDPGIHAAARWLLHRWNDGTGVSQVNSDWSQDAAWRAARWDSVRSALETDDEKPSPQWWINGQGQTLVILPGPSVFQMGSPETELMREDDETPHRKRIGRTFAMSAGPVTVEEYRRFDPSYEIDPKITPTADCPVVRIDWYQAAAYCNWISAEEGIPQEQWCYETENDADGNSRIVRLRENSLSAAGYRLPTEAEMEFATRAGAVTARCYGETDELLPAYAWFARNSQRRAWPVGLLKPNDFGLFDVHGNVNFWCQEIFEDYPMQDLDHVADDVEGPLEITSTGSRVFRGGSFKDDASLVRSAYRNAMPPDQSYRYLGLRIARTILPK